MKIELIVVGPLQSNCFIVYDEKTLKSMVIDPGDDPEHIMKTIEEKKLKVVYIVCTHAHFDHVGAVAKLKSETGAEIVLHKDELEIYMSAKDQGAFWGYQIEQPPDPDKFVQEGDLLTAGELTFEVLHTPGHSPGGICLQGKGIVITGDTIFAGSVGRTDFYGGDLEELKKSFRRIISLNPETRILPGHGDVTTVKREKDLNFFMHEL